ncbi:hypothetical protein BRADI_1g36585v3 [Brachypodium distachyon]|uniref:Secreted protein n=1 Tax=Brachypodium distachyon TaxID=15368 RepID=A0A2K2DN42_BRADI|nr:hypothetical protein BRADI_1g36585v3 [Brachypodium distachyon]
MCGPVIRQWWCLETVLAFKFTLFAVDIGPAAELAGPADADRCGKQKATRWAWRLAVQVSERYSTIFVRVFPCFN